MHALLLLAGLIPAIWAAGVLIATDLAVPARSTDRFRKVLAVFPHADDETVHCGGLLARLAGEGAAVTLLLLTGGERGNPAGRPDPRLKLIRAAEAKRAARALGVFRLICEDFADAGLDVRRAEVEAYLAQTLETIRPDLIITYDLSGMDGHPDHIACAQALTAQWRLAFPRASLWYVTMPPRLVRLLTRAGQLPASREVDKRRAPPTVRIFLGMRVLPKIRAWYVYRSQRRSIAKGWGRLVPAWFAVSMLQCEYFAEVT